MEEKDFQTREAYIEYLETVVKKNCDVLSEDLKKKEEELRSLREKNKDLEKDRTSAINECEATLRVVKAMLQNSICCGATHRMRDWYGKSIIKYITASIDHMEDLKYPFPF